MNRRWLWGAVGMAAAGTALYRLLHVPRLAQTSTPAPCPNYGEALARARALQARDDTSVVGACRTKLYTHNDKTARAFVLLHGFTNCPQQYGQMAEELHADGHNVIVPRFPYHGLDRMSDDARFMTAEQMIETSSTAVDIACGLGESVTVIGLSMGGILATWLAMHRPELEQVIVISPALATRAVSPRRVRPYVGALGTAPNFFRWWDPVLKAEVNGAAHAYPRMSSRAFAQLLRMGFIVGREAGERLPAAASVTLVLNPCDQTVDNDIARALFTGWRVRGAPVTLFEFPADLGLIHDLIDPSQPEQQVDNVYPALYEVADGRTPALLSEIAV
jgi:pimeloyl-ACP methyl ester carboxylesterase